MPADEERKPGCCAAVVATMRLANKAEANRNRGFITRCRSYPYHFLIQINAGVRGAPLLYERLEKLMKVMATMTLAVLMMFASLEAQVPDFTPQTPLIGALLHNDPAEAARLLRKGADPNEGRFTGVPPLILAAVRQDAELVRLMAAKGADLDVRDRSGATALMWSAFNDTGDAAMVEALLALGADPLAPNKAGEIPLDWALRRGETPAVAALRKAGASNTVKIRAAAQKSVALLQRSGAQFAAASKCYSCHHQAVPQIAFGIARTRGIEADGTLTLEQIAAATAQMTPVLAEALQNRDRIPDPPIAISYALVAFAAAGHARDEATEAMSQVVAAWQDDSGRFHSLPPMRPPLEASDVTATALSLRAIQLYGTQQDERVARAVNWLRTEKPRTTEDHAMQLLGLTWGHARLSDIRKSTTSLLAIQRQDGGWGQTPTLESDAYATGQALVALQTAGYAASSQQYQRGIGFLLRTQFSDGSWLVRTRTFPVQMPRDSGFPHGANQWISAAGTGWASMALMLALPAQRCESPRGELLTNAADSFGRDTQIGREHPLRDPGCN